MHRFYSTQIDITDAKAELDESETKHLRDVLRLRGGDSVRVFDGAGSEFEARVDEITRKATRLTGLRPVESTAPESNLDLTLALALTKPERFELAIQKAVELGVNSLVPVVSHRCDVKPAGIEKKSERWRKIALDAAKQCGRSRLMRIEETITFDSLLNRRLTGSGLVLFSERAGLPFKTVEAREQILAVVGPVGGWEDSELAAAKRAGFTIVTMGGRILRAETAAIVIAAILQHRFGDLN